MLLIVILTVSTAVGIICIAAAECGVGEVTLII